LIGEFTEDKRTKENLNTIVKQQVGFDKV